MILCRNSLAFWLIGGLIFAGNCSRESNPVGNIDCIRDNSDGLTPFKVGNKWIIRFYYYDTSGSVITTFLDSFVVRRDTIIGKERWYKIPGLKPADLDTRDWYTNRSDGIWVRRRYYDSSITYLTFKFPTMEGDSWGNQIHDSTRTVSTNEVIETPSGIDTCIHYEDHYQFSQLGDFHYFIAPHKGWVVFEEFTQTNSGRLYVVARDVLVKAILK
ncbi:MAG: hypothetical protein HYR76_10930 [Ignavibacteria bacterium]|nr:hypothetical protein [Ignavibacteria bacterium]